MNRDSVNWSLTTALKNLQTGKLSVEEYVTELLAHSKSHQELAAYITDTGEQALAAARAIDAKDSANPLQGIPLVVKDNIDVAGVATTAATPRLQKHIPNDDSLAWQRLAAAGALLFGKTSMHELAYGITGVCTGAPTALNPINKDYLAGGSSSGTAAAVAAGFAPAGLGTDTGGSIRIPAAVCGIFGFRPTTGRYPHDGVIRVSPSRDTVGVMARSMEDIILLDKIISGDSTQATNNNTNPHSIRLALPEQAWNHLDPEIERVTSDALSSLQIAGYSLVATGADIHGGPSNELLDIAIAVPPAETLKALAAYLSVTGSDATAEEVIRDIASPDVRHILSPLLEETNLHHAYPAALAAQEQLRTAAAESRRSHNVQAVITPTTVLPAPPLDVGDYVDVEGVQIPTFLAYIRNTAPSAVLGTPSVTIPIGVTSNGLPVGLQIDGHPTKDAELLQLAFQLSQLFDPDIACKRKKRASI